MDLFYYVTDDPAWSKIEENVPQILKFVTIDLEIHSSNGQMNKVHLPFAFFVASNAFPGMFFLHYIYFCV